VVVQECLLRDELMEGFRAAVGWGRPCHGRIAETWV
jgi:hypothetical protein